MNRRWLSGMALMELLIVMGLGSGVLLALTSMVAGSMALNSRLLNSARLNEELGNVFALIQADIRRAGYNGDSLYLMQNGPANGVFSQHLVFDAYGAEQANSCVTFRYDANGNGLLDTLLPNEQFGYRMQNNTVEIRKAGASCKAKGWEDVTDSDVVKVTALEFRPVTQLLNGVPVTHVAITLSGYLKANPALSQTYHTTVLVKNHVG